MGSQLPKTTAYRGCLFLFLTLFLFILLIPMIVKFILDLHYRSYVQGTCTILSEEILTVANDGSASDAEGPFYIPHMHFAVWISGHALQTEGNPLYSYGEDPWGSKFGEKRTAQAILDQYEIGKNYPCWYNPSSPSEALLTLDRGAIAWNAFFFMPLFFLLFIAFLLLSLKYRTDIRAVWRGDARSSNTATDSTPPPFS